MGIVDLLLAFLFPMIIRQISGEESSLFFDCKQEDGFGGWVLFCEWLALWDCT